MASPDTLPRYGGRALRNGVMMVGPHSVAVAVRRSDGQISTAAEPFTAPGAWSRSIPFVRGLVTFAGALKMAAVASRLEGRLNLGGSRLRATLPQFAPAIGAGLADRLTRELAGRANPRLVVPLETVAGVVLPFAAFGLSGQMPGVRELWRYHGAEHKAVNTVEAGLALTPENATSMSRIHPRCGTVFAFWGMLGGTAAKAVISRLPDGRRKAVLGALAGPLVLSTAFEMVRLGWFLRDRPLARALFTPAWQSQRMTTAEPNREELEVAIAALQAVIEFEAEIPSGSHGDTVEEATPETV